MRAFPGFDRQRTRGFVSALCCGLLTASLALASPALAAGGYYLKSVALDPNYPQVREYFGEAYVIEGKYDLAKEQLSRIEKLCSKDCEYYEDLADALTEAHAL
jgi:predicted Zn-dependent protease